MEKQEEELIKTLSASDGELRALYDEHLTLEKDLAELNGRLHLSSAEEHQRREIQKRKLAGMDRIMAILADHRTSSPSA